MSELNDIICELLEIFIHNVLCKRNIYPATIFTKHTKYGVIIYKSLYPQLNDYIENVIRAVHFHLKEGTLKSVFICLKSNDQTFERYVVNILSFINNNPLLDPLYIKLEQFIRTFMLKFQSIDSYLSTVPEDCEFTIELTLKEGSFIKFNDNVSQDHFPWTNVNNDDSTQKNFNIIPMNQIKCDQFHLQFYVETVL